MAGRFFWRFGKALGVSMAVAAPLACLYYQPAFLVGGLRRVFPGIVWIGGTQEKLAALTFDDGPDERYTPQILEALRLRGAKATFFLMGSKARAIPALVERIRDEGHLVANHLSDEHRALFMGEQAMEESLLRTEGILGLAGRDKWVRPPGITFQPSFLRMARRHGYRVALGSAYVSDPWGTPAGYIEWAMTRMLKPGVIIVLHDSGGDRRATVRAVPRILDNALRRGYRFVTLAELPTEP